MRILMCRKTFLVRSLLLVALGVMSGGVVGQGSSDDVPQANSVPARSANSAAAVEQDKIVSMKVERGVRIAVRNRAGRITIKGWDGDMVEATATSERGAETVQTAMTSDPSGDRFSLSTNMTENRSDVRSLSSGLKVDLPVQLGGRRRVSGLEVNFEVKVPRYVEIESVSIDTGDIEITDLDGPVVTVRCNDGDIRVQDVKGFVNTVTRNGDITIQNAGGNVRAFSLLGKISVQCARGQVEAGNTRGDITLAAIAGNVDVNTTNGNVEFTGSIQANGRYHLKTVMGKVRMSVEADTGEGFTATLSSYRGKVETDFALIVQSPPENVRHLVGHYGAGQAQLTLDSFHGDVSLLTAASGSMQNCSMR